MHEEGYLHSLERLGDLVKSYYIKDKRLPSINKCLEYLAQNKNVTACFTLLTKLGEVYPEQMYGHCDDPYGINTYAEFASHMYHDKQILNIVIDSLTKFKQTMSAFLIQNKQA